VSKINPEIAHLAVPVADLRHYEGNPKKHDLAAIADSLTVNGQYRPIVVWKSSSAKRHGRVLAGNGTLEAARDRLGWTEIAATWVEATPKQAAKIVAADNRIGELAGFDDAALVEVLREAGLEGTGYGESDLDKLLKSLEAETQQAPELGFSMALMEEHNYVVLAFDNGLDWQAAVQALGIETVKAWDAKDKYVRAGVGRVVPGAPVVRRLIEAGAGGE
jgi:ParB-like chromosome segregation protein Spo0J